MFGCDGRVAHDWQCFRYGKRQIRGEDGWQRSKGEISVTQRSNFSISVGAAGCAGNGSGKLTTSGPNRWTATLSDSGQKCEISIEKKGNRFLTSEGSGCDFFHGATCSFEGYVEAISRTSSARALDIPFSDKGGDGQAAWCASSTVTGVDPKGDGFLAVRAGPGIKYRKLDEIHNGDIVSSCDSRGSWVAIVYGPSKRKGWVNGKFLKDLAG
ncbi:SH3 domain-containing protein [Phyllobacterium trifolii]|uniref:SH3 domain-containing protein n=1 Tax=Phyllobacterium trifolii TaxID=300193 RepID=UPI0016218BD9